MLGHLLFSYAGPGTQGGPNSASEPGCPGTQHTHARTRTHAHTWVLQYSRARALGGCLCGTELAATHSAHPASCVLCLGWVPAWFAATGRGPGRCAHLADRSRYCSLIWVCQYPNGVPWTVPWFLSTTQLCRFSGTIIIVIIVYHLGIGFFSQQWVCCI